MVEFALLLPLLLLILCGIIDFGWIFSNQYRIDNAAGTGARYAALSSTDGVSSSIIDTVVNVTAANLPDGDPSHVSVTVDPYSEQITVSVDYPVKTLTFVASTIYGNTFNAHSSAIAAY